MPHQDAEAAPEEVRERAVNVAADLDYLVQTIQEVRISKLFRILAGLCLVFPPDMAPRCSAFSFLCA
jgi:hypothetical protein